MGNYEDRAIERIQQADTVEKVWDLIANLAVDNNGYPASVYLENVRAYAATAQAMIDQDKDEKPKPERYRDRYTTRVQALSNRVLISEFNRFENMDNIDRIDQIRYNFVKTELDMRRSNGTV